MPMLRDGEQMVDIYMCEHILISAWQQPCYNMFADL
jgi:hypothetical protein